MLILTEAKTLKPTSFAGTGRLKDVTSVWKAAADSQRDQHVSRTFSTLWKIADSGFIILIVLVTEGFCFLPAELKQAFTNKPFTASDCRQAHPVKTNFNGQMTGKLLPHDDEYFRHLLWYLFINATLCCREIPKIFGMASNKTAPWKTDFLKQRLILRWGLEQHK